MIPSKPVAGPIPSDVALHAFNQVRIMRQVQQVKTRHTILGWTFFLYGTTVAAAQSLLLFRTITGRLSAWGNRNTGTSTLRARRTTVPNHPPA
jgi:hypothetical protein